MAWRGVHACTHTLLGYVVAAVAEIGGRFCFCFCFWIWLGLRRSAWIAVAGVLLLALFAWALTRVDSAFAGRAYAAYGGVYIITSLAWLWTVEGVRPDRADVIGALLRLVGSGVIPLGRAALSAP